MDKDSLLLLGQLIVILNFTHTYVLFAANLDDFKSIAKKFIPNKLADQLTEMASQNSMKYRQQLNKNKQVHSEKEAEDYSDEEYENKEVTKPAAVRKIVTTPKKRFNIKDQVTDIDFDKLVDRVREQLEDKFKTQLKSDLQNESQKKEHRDYSKQSVAHVELKNNKPITITSKINNIRKDEVTPKSTTEDSQIYYEDAVAEKGAAENDGMMFQEADLTKTKDSYEDYVTPNKEKIFESDAETKTTKPQRVPSENESKDKVQRLNAVKEPVATLDDEQDYAEHKSEEVKAKTETLLDEPEQKGNKPKKLKGTMIPTRQYYKLSSPNYYDKVPVVAEKYDFNEPLPEKDREPENLKYFVNPPARINKKVRLTSN